MKRHWTEWPDSLYEKFMKYPEWVRIAIAIGSVLAILILFSIPGSTIIAAVIAFGATFSGIFVSFWVERRRKDQEEKDQFARLVRAIKMENTVNDGLVTAVLRDIKPGMISALSFETETSQTAMSDPRFYRWADQSLIHTIAIVRSDLATFNNLLIAYRDVIVGGGTFGKVPVEKVKIIADANLERVRVLHRVLDEALSAQPIADTRFSEVSATLNKIVDRQNERLEELSKTQPEKDDNTEIESGPAG